MLLPCSSDELEDLVYRRVNVKGVFDHSKELYMYPRSFIEEGDAPSGGFGTKPKSGAWVITSFLISNSE